MNKNISILVLTAIISGLSIFAIEASLYETGGAPHGVKERMEQLAMQIKTAARPEESSVEAFNIFKKKLEQNLKTGKLNRKDFDVPNIMPRGMPRGNCAIQPNAASFRQWLAEEISNCDTLSGEYFSGRKLSESDIQMERAKFKERRQPEKTRLLEMQAILLKSSSTESNWGSIASLKIPFRLITASLLVCAGIGLWFFLNHGKKSKATAQKGSGSE